MYSRNLLPVDPNLVAPAFLQAAGDLAVASRHHDADHARPARQRHEEVLVIHILVEDDRPASEDVLLRRLTGACLEHGVEPSWTPRRVQPLLDVAPVLYLDPIEQGN